MCNANCHFIRTQFHLIIEGIWASAEATLSFLNDSVKTGTETEYIAEEQTEFGQQRVRNKAN